MNFYKFLNFLPPLGRRIFPSMVYFIVCFSIYPSSGRNLSTLPHPHTSIRLPMDGGVNLDICRSLWDVHRYSRLICQCVSEYSRITVYPHIIPGIHKHPIYIRVVPYIPGYFQISKIKAGLGGGEEGEERESVQACTCMTPFDIFLFVFCWLRCYD